MSTLLIGYDLNTPGQDYEKLFDAIKDVANGYWHHLDSTWLIKTDLTPKQLRDKLKDHIDSGDELLVIDVTGDPAAWIGFNQRASAWLKNNL